MKMTDVTASEFELSEDGVFHVPSGAMFWCFPESADPYKIDWAKAQDTDDENGPLFDSGWIESIARDLLRERQTKND